MQVEIKIDCDTISVANFNLEEKNMQFKDWKELQSLCPITNGIWNKEFLYEYLVQSCNQNFSKQIELFFVKYQDDEQLADLLFSFLLNDDYDGSDAQMGAAHFIYKMDKQLLKVKKELLMKAQENEVYWKRPFPHDEHLEWFEK